MGYRRSSTFFILLLTLLVGASACVSTHRAQNTFTHDVVAEVSAPYIAWGTPLAGGPIRALFVAPRFTLGDVSEIAARLDMEHESVALWDAHNIGYDPMALPELPEGGQAEDILLRLQQLLRRRWDVIVLANFDTDGLPEPVLSEILEKVVDGAGLLIVQARNTPESPLYTIINALEEDDTAPSLVRGVGECAYPGGGPQHISTRQLIHGDGRIIVLDYPGDPPIYHCLVQTPADPLDMQTAYADNTWSLVARAVYTASGRAPGATIIDVRDAAPQGPDDDEIPPDFYPEFVQAMRDSVVAQPARPFEVTLREPADQRYTIQAQLRRVDSDTQVRYRDPAIMAHGAKTHRVEIPVGPGVYFIDVWLSTHRGVVDWFTSEITVPGWPEFYGLELDKTYLLPNDSLEATLEVRPVLNTTRKTTLYMRAMDTFGRLVSDVGREVSHEGGPVSLRMHFSDLLAPLLKVEVFAVEGSKRRFSEWELLGAFRDVRYVGVRQRHPPLTMELVGVTQAPVSHQQLRYMRALSEIGVSSLHMPAEDATLVHAAQQRLRLVPQLERIAGDHVRAGRYREPCLNAPVYRGQLEEELRDKTLRYFAGVHGRYSLGNLNYFSATDERVCQCSHCLDRFQTMLSQEYDSLADLNLAWNTDFGDWDFIALPDSFGPGHDAPVAPWLDFQRFRDNTFAEFHRWARAVIMHTDPTAQVGARFPSAAPRRHGCHWPELLNAIDFAAIEYAPAMVEVLRSYQAPGAWSGVVLTGQSTSEDERLYPWLPWHLLFNQLPTLWLDGLFGDSDTPATDAWLLPDGRTTDTLNTLAATVRHIQDTVGPLLLNAEADAPAIAIYDSHSARHFSEMDHAYKTTYSASQTAATTLLRLAGYDTIQVDRTQLLRSGGPPARALILPMIRTLDTEECDALLRYVSEGGALIADVLPGPFDQHGRPVVDPVTASIFGVRKAGIANVENDVLSATGLDPDIPELLGRVEVDTALSLHEGVALAQVGDTSAWITNRRGDGHTLLLNYPFRDVIRRERQRLTPGEFHALAAFIGDLPDVPKPLHGMETPFLGRSYGYTYGNARIIALHADYDAPRQTLRLPFDRHDNVYNPITGERFPRPHRTRVHLQAGEHRILVTLPSEPRELALHVPEVIHAGQRLPIRINLEGASGNMGRHIFLVDFGPWNQPALPWYRRIEAVDAGIAETFIPLALDEIPGRYTLRVRELLTGFEAQETVAVSSPTE